MPPTPRSPDNQTAVTAPKLLGRLTKHVSPRRRRQFFVVLALMLIGAASEILTLGAVVPFISLMADPEIAYDYPLLQRLFQSAGWNRPNDIVLPMTALFLALVLLATGMRLLLLWVSNRYVFAFGYDIGVNLYRRVLEQPYSFHVSNNTSETIAAVNKVQFLISGVLKPIMEGLIALVLSVAIVAALLLVNTVAILTAAGAFIICYALIAGFVRLRLRKNGALISEAQTERVRFVQEGLGAIRDVILDNSQDIYTRTFARSDQKLRRAQANNQFLNQIPRYLIEAIGIFLIIGLALYLSLKAGGLMGALPTLGALALGAQRLLPLMQKIYGAWSRITGNQQVFIDVLELLELPTEVEQDSGTVSRVHFERNIQLDRVTFRYGRDDQPVLQDLSLSIAKGSRVGIAGPTGSGKSTLVDIIMGLLTPTGGRLLVDGTPVENRNRRAWQNRISHVPQSIFLADATIAENIAVGVPFKQIDMGRVRHAARCARIDEHIESRPLGYRATVGERGVQLSGGQRQRIGIARAIYRRADLLVLDEATSALDMETEAAVIDRVTSDEPGVTILMIAHRLDTLATCDRVIRLRSGQVAADGSYEEVIGRSGRALHQA